MNDIMDEIQAFIINKINSLSEQELAELLSYIVKLSVVRGSWIHFALKSVIIDLVELRLQEFGRIELG